MKETGNYIKSIEIDALWSGTHRVMWELKPGVNILSGVNGMGKSTILNRVVKQLLEMDTLERSNSGVKLTFDPESATCVDFDVVRSFDLPVLTAELVRKAANVTLNTELDFSLYQLQRRYLDYQVNLSNRMVALFTSQAADAQQQAQQIAQEKSHFQDIVDSLFCDTGKKINRESNEIEFLQMGETISPVKLSSGEKQILIILLTVLVQNRRPYVLLMDEPEVSLHVEWQQRLLNLITDLNPNAQIILTTHSPALIMNGWMDRVTDIEDIIR